MPRGGINDGLTLTPIPRPRGAAQRLGRRASDLLVAAADNEAEAQAAQRLARQLQEQGREIRLILYTPTAPAWPRIPASTATRIIPMSCLRW